jgi:hypothetical protein
MFIGWLVCNVTHNIVKYFSYYVSKIILMILQHVSFQGFFKAFGGISWLLGLFKDLNLGFASLFSILKNYLNYLNFKL